MSPLSRMPSLWWLMYGDEVNCGIAGTASAVLRHIAEEEREIDTLVAQGRWSE